MITQQAIAQSDITFDLVSLDVLDSLREAALTNLEDYLTSIHSPSRTANDELWVYVEHLHWIENAAPVGKWIIRFARYYPFSIDFACSLFIEVDFEDDIGAVFERHGLDRVDQNKRCNVLDYLTFGFSYDRHLQGWKYLHERA